MLTGIRDRALVSLSLRHVDLTKSPPLVRQEPDRVQTKFAKAINTYFFPLGDDLTEIVVRWIEELQKDHLFAPNDPLFPKTKMAQDEDKSFRVAGTETVHLERRVAGAGYLQGGIRESGSALFSAPLLEAYARPSHAHCLPDAQRDQSLEPEPWARERCDDADVLWDH